MSTIETKSLTNGLLKTLKSGNISEINKFINVDGAIRKANSVNINTKPNATTNTAKTFVKQQKYGDRAETLTTLGINIKRYLDFVVPNLVMKLGYDNSDYLRTQGNTVISKSLANKEENSHFLLLDNEAFGGESAIIPLQDFTPKNLSRNYLKDNKNQYKFELTDNSMVLLYKRTPNKVKNLNGSNKADVVLRASILSLPKSKVEELNNLNIFGDGSKFKTDGTNNEPEVLRPIPEDTLRPVLAIFTGYYALIDLDIVKEFTRKLISVDSLVKNRDSIIYKYNSNNKLVSSKAKNSDYFLFEEPVILEQITDIEKSVKQ